MTLSEVFRGPINRQRPGRKPLRHRAATGQSIPWCFLKWMPDDSPAASIARGIRFDNQTLTISEGVFEYLNGLSFPIDDFPTGARSPTTTDGTDGVDPLNYFGITYDNNAGLEFGDAALVPAVFDDQYAGIPHDIHDFYTHLPINFTTQKSYCGRSLLAPHYSWQRNVNYREYDRTTNDEQTFTLNNIRGQGYNVILNRRIWKQAKMIVSNAYYSDPDDMPKTQAQITAAAPLEFSLHDVWVKVYYNDTAGWPKHSLLVDHSIYDTTHAYLIDWDPLWRPNIHLNDGTWHRKSIEVGRRQLEQTTLGGTGSFLNGQCSYGGTSESDFNTSFRKLYQIPTGFPSASRTFGIWTPDTAVDPYNVPTSSLNMNNNGGYPKTLTSYNNGGFVNFCIAFDADWNSWASPLLCSVARDTVSATLVAFWGDSPTDLDGDPVTADQIETLSPPNYPPDFIPAENIRHASRLFVPCHYTGDRTVAQTLQQGTDDRPPGINLLSISASSNASHYQSDTIPESVWTNPADFTRPMPSTGVQNFNSNANVRKVTNAFGVTTTTNSTASGTSGPTVTAIGEATDAEFTREET